MCIIWWFIVVELVNIKWLNGNVEKWVDVFVFLLKIDISELLNVLVIIFLVILLVLGLNLDIFIMVELLVVSVVIKGLKVIIIGLFYVLIMLIILIGWYINLIFVGCINKFVWWVLVFIYFLRCLM